MDNAHQHQRSQPEGGGRQDGEWDGGLGWSL
jgi:hypothetical protein